MATTRTKTQKGHVFRKGKSWFMRYSDSELRNGEAVRVQKCVKLADYSDVYRSEKSVRALAAERLAPINSGALDIRSTMSVREFIAGTYLPEIQRTKRPSTYKNAKDIFKLHVGPRLGNVTLRNFRCCDGEQLLADIVRQDLIKDKLTKNKRPLARNSLMRIKSFLSGAFRTARRLGALDSSNPMVDVSLQGGTAPRATGAYSLEEIRAIVAVLREPARTIVLCAAYSGLRQGEIRGLCWKDFAGNTLTVSRSMWNGLEQKPKTVSSAAPIPVVKPLREALELHKLRAGVLAKDEWPIFMSAGMKDGQPSPINLANIAARTVRPSIEVCKVCRKNKRSHTRTVDHEFQLDASLTWKGWHSFRRGLATTLHQLHVADKEIQAILRHSNVAITQACYIKSLSESQVSALDLVAEKMQSCNETATRSSGLVN